MPEACEHEWVDIINGVCTKCDTIVDTYDEK